MKKRLAKKIMGQRADRRLSYNKTSLYWLDRWLDYEFWSMNLNSKCDHRIVQAISKTKKK